MASNDQHGKADDEGVTSAPRKKFQRTEEEDYGYYFYPQRSGSEEVKSFWSSLWGRPEANNFRCEANVVWCLQNSEFHFQHTHTHTHTHTGHSVYISKSSVCLYVCV